MANSNEAAHKKMLSIINNKIRLMFEAWEML